MKKSHLKIVIACLIIDIVIISLWLTGCASHRAVRSETEPIYKTNCVDRALCSAIIATRNGYLVRIGISEGSVEGDNIHHCQTEAFRKGKWRPMGWKGEVKQDSWHGKTGKHIEYWTLEEAFDKWTKERIK